MKPSGITIEAREEQSEKQYCPKKFRVEGRVTEVRERQPLKQLLSQVTPSGITTEVSEEQLAKQYCPMFLTLSGIDTEVRERQPEKQLALREVTPSGIE